jgi:hypothetical protein
MAGRIGISKGGRTIDLVPRTKVVTNAAPLRRSVMEKVAPPQIRTRNLTPTPIVAAATGQARRTTTNQTNQTNQTTRSTVWWRLLAATDQPRQ